MRVCEYCIVTVLKGRVESRIREAIATLLHRALQIFPDEECSDQWLQTPNDNPLFGGSAPMEKMLGGFVVDLATVREFIDSQLSE